MVYPKYITISTMKELDLFDNISYKYIKDIINKDDDFIDVDIEDVDCDRVCWCKTRFKFEIDLGSCSGILKVDLIKEYNGSSPYALMMCALDEDEDTDEEEEKEDED